MDDFGHNQPYLDGNSVILLKTVVNNDHYSNYVADAYVIKIEMYSICKI